MYRTLLLAVVSGFFCLTTGLAEDSPIARSAENKAAPKSDGWTKKAAHLDHLRRAVEHLEAAGLNELAAKVEQHAETEVLHAELAQKRLQLEKINEDIKRLERLLTSDEKSPRPSLRTQVTTRVKILEVDLGRLRELGLDVGPDGLGGVLFEDAVEGAEQSLKQRVLNDGSVVKLLEWLRENKVAKLVAEPVVMTISGRSATFFTGGQVPVITRDGEDYAIVYRNVGTQVEVLPTVLEEDKIRLEFRPTLSRVVPASFADKLDGKEPDYESRSFKAAVVLRSGQTMAIGGLTAAAKDSLPESLPKDGSLNSKPDLLPTQTEHIFLVTAEIVKSGSAPPEFIKPTHVPRALPVPAVNR